MLRVCIESPFKPTDDEVAKYAGRFTRSELLRQNLVYARRALLDSLGRGEAPFASHLLYTQVWSESFDLRDAGIKAGLEFAHVATRVVLYTDLGVSAGMLLAQKNAELIGTAVERRTLFLNDGDPRDTLAAWDLETWPYLEELAAQEHVARMARAT